MLRDANAAILIYLLLLVIQHRRNLLVNDLNFQVFKVLTTESVIFWVCNNRLTLSVMTACLFKVFVSTCRTT